MAPGGLPPELESVSQLLAAADRKHWWEAAEHKRQRF